MLRLFLTSVAVLVPLKVRQPGSGPGVGGEITAMLVTGTVVVDHAGGVASH